MNRLIHLSFVASFLIPVLSYSQPIQLETVNPPRLERIKQIFSDYTIEKGQYNDYVYTDKDGEITKVYFGERGNCALWAKHEYAPFGGRGEKVGLEDKTDGKKIFTTKWPQYYSHWGKSFSPDGRYFVSVVLSEDDKEYTVDIFDISKNQLTVKAKKFPYNESTDDSPHLVAYNGGNIVVFTQYKGAGLSIMNLNTGEITTNNGNSSSEMSWMMLSPDNEWIYLDGEGYLNLNTGEKINGSEFRIKDNLIGRYFTSDSSFAIQDKFQISKPGVGYVKMESDNSIIFFDHELNYITYDKKNQGISIVDYLSFDGEQLEPQLGYEFLYSSEVPEGSLTAMYAEIDKTISKATRTSSAYKDYYKGLFDIIRPTSFEIQDQLILDGITWSWETSDYAQREKLMNWLSAQPMSYLETAGADGNGKRLSVVNEFITETKYNKVEIPLGTAKLNEQLALLTNETYYQPIDEIIAKADTSLALVNYHGRPEFKKTIGFYEMAIAKEPKNPAHYCSLANAYLMGGEYDSAYVKLEKALELSPNYPSALFQLIRRDLMRIEQGRIFMDKTNSGRITTLAGRYFKAATQQTPSEYSFVQLAEGRARLFLNNPDAYYAYQEVVNANGNKQQRMQKIDSAIQLINPATDLFMRGNLQSLLARDLFETKTSSTPKEELMRADKLFTDAEKAGVKTDYAIHASLNYLILKNESKGSEIIKKWKLAEPGSKAPDYFVANYYLSKANDLFRASRYQEALNIYQQYLPKAEAPTREALYGAAVSKVKLSDLASAKKYFDQLAELYSLEDIKALYPNIEEWYQYAANPTATVPTIIDNYPTIKEARDLYDQGFALANSGDQENSLALFNQSLEKYRSVGYKSGMALVKEKIGVSYFFMGQLDQAIAALNESIELIPAQYSAYNMLKSLYQYKKEYSKAIETLDRLAKSGYEEPFFKNKLASQYAAIGLKATEINNYNSARTALEKSVALDEVANVYQSLGLVLYTLYSQSQSSSGTTRLQKNVSLSSDVKPAIRKAIALDPDLETDNPILRQILNK